MAGKGVCVCVIATNSGGRKCNNNYIGTQTASLVTLPPPPPPPPPPNLFPFHRAKPLIPRWITSYLIVITFIWQVSTYNVYTRNGLRCYLVLQPMFSFPPSPTLQAINVGFLKIIRVVVDANNTNAAEVDLSVSVCTFPNP